MPSFFNFCIKNGIKVQKKTTRHISSPTSATIFDFLCRQSRPRRLDAIARAIGVTDKKELSAMLAQLAEAGKIARLSGGMWLALNNIALQTGQFRQLASGNGLVTLSDGTEIAVRGANTGNAWDKDLVRVQLLPEKNEGKIIDVVKRIQTLVPARFIKREGKNIVCQFAGKGFPFRFHARLDSAKISGKKPAHGELLGLKPEKKLGPDLWQASIQEIFPDEDNIATQETLVKNAHSVPGAFPAQVLEYAAMLPATPDLKDIEGREDLRLLPFVTIDGADARDFDDAIHVEKTPDGWILRVAIADVSHYVKPDSNPNSLDGEALKRGNSWYFPRSVEPMLPFALSNGLCSLRPDEDRLAMLAEMTIGKNGITKSARFAPIVMRSHARLTYDQAAAFFAGSTNAGITNPEVTRMMTEALELYKALAKMRHERGTLEFELPEPAYSFNADGSLADIKTAERNDAHCLIEEFMIAANEAVARHLGKAKLPFPYRVHPAPEQGRLDGLFETLQLSAAETLPPNVTRETLGKPKTIQRILEAARNTPSEYVVNRLCLRAMAQAKYQPGHEGHFGLASSDYCHFTSPIRRYADLLTHRALKVSLGLSSRDSLPTDEELSGISENLNKLEREALECERDIARRLGCMALKDRIGQVLPGSVSGVTEFGLFVEFKEMPAEGLIRLSELADDWYEFDQKNQMLIGKNTGQVWKLGQPVETRIIGVDLDRFETRLAPANLKPGRKLSGHKKGKGSSFEKSPRFNSKKKTGKGKEKAASRRSKRSN